MKALSKVASALSFAHLSGLGSKARAEADEDEEKKESAKRAEVEDDEKKAKKAEDDKEEEFAEGDDDEAKAEDDKPEEKDAEDEEDKKDAKKAKASDDEEDKDDPDSEMRGSSAAASARRREQARCASIFASKAAARNPALAANLAFKTRLTRSEALAVLEETPSAAAPVPSNRASKNPDVGNGSAPAPSKRQAIASSWDAAFAAVPGHQRRA